MIRKVSLCAILFLCLNFSNIAFSQTLRCDGRLIKEGMDKSFVLEHCGEPEHKERTIYGAPYGGVQAEKLYYERGGRRIIVEIRMDEVTNISWEEE
jgi:hypothetical protein